jgi:hypothetical protein
MSIETAIRMAIDEGCGDPFDYLSLEKREVRLGFFYDPDFWRSLAKALGRQDCAQMQADFLDHITGARPVESFFASMP